MALKETIQAILTHLATIDVVTADGITVPLYARVWNNQVDYIRSGQLQVFQTPAVYVEFVMGEGGNIGQNYNGNEVVLRFHLVHNHYNTEGSFEQDLLIFDLRDLVCALLNRYKCIHLSPLQKLTEQQDFSHDNIYHYIIDYSTHFVDDLDDAISSPLILSVPPIVLSYQVGVYKINSLATFQNVAVCELSVTTFNVNYIFSTVFYFQNGTVIKIEYNNSLGTLQSVTSSGMGYTFDSNTMEITITNINLLSTTFAFEYKFINPGCKDEIIFDTNVDTISNLLYPGELGTQQNSSQTYTPPQ